MLTAVDDRSSLPSTLPAVSSNGTLNNPGLFRVNRTEESGRTEFELYPTTVTTQMGSTGPFASEGPQGHCKVHEVSLTVDDESGQEK